MQIHARSLLEILRGKKKKKKKAFSCPSFRPCAQARKVLQTRPVHRDETKGHEIFCFVECRRWDSIKLVSELQSEVCTTRAQTGTHEKKDPSTSLRLRRTFDETVPVTFWQVGRLCCVPLLFFACLSEKSYFKEK